MRKSTGDRIRATSGVRKNAEAVDTQLVCDREDVGRPVGIPPTSLVRRAAIAGAVDPDESHTGAIDYGAVERLIEFQP
jgi:hypothetical protein